MMNMNNMNMNNMNNMNGINNMNINKINIVFKAATDVNYTLICNYGITISDMFKEYFSRIDRENLFEDNNNKIEFIYNGKAINFHNNNTKIEDFFEHRNNVSIQVLTNDLIGAQDLNINKNKIFKIFYYLFILLYLQIEYIYY